MTTVLALPVSFRFPFSKTWRASLPGGLVAQLAVYYDTAEDEATGGGYDKMGLACRKRAGADKIYKGKISTIPTLSSYGIVCAIIALDPELPLRIQSI